MKRPVPVEELLAHRRFLTSLAAALVHDPHDAEDVVQETWKIALHSPPGHAGNLRGWLRQVLHRVVIRRAHRRHLQQLADVEAGKEVSPNELSAAEVVESRELFQWLAGRVHQLDEPYRTILLLRFYEGRSRQEIAQRLGRPLNTVNSQLLRATKRLREQLDTRHEGRRSQWVWLLAMGLRVRERERHPGSVVASKRNQLIAMGVLLVLVIGWYGLRRGATVDDSSDVPPKVGSAEMAGASPSATRSPASSPPETPIPEASSVESSVPPSTDQRQLQVTVLDAQEQPVPEAQLFVIVETLQGEEFVPWTRTSPRGRALVAVEERHLRVLNELDEARPVASFYAEADGRVSSLIHSMACPKGTVREVTLRTRGPAAAVNLEVVDPEGQPVSQARIRMGHTNPPMKRAEGHYTQENTVLHLTDERGLVQVTGLIAGNHRVLVDAKGFSRGRDEVAVSPSFEASKRIILGFGAVLAGTVRNQFGIPVPHARVSIELIYGGSATDPEVRCDEQGRFRLEGIPEGRFWAWAEDAKEEATLAAAQMVFLDGSHQNWSPRLMTVNPIQLQVVQPNGRPFPDAVGLVKIIHQGMRWDRLVEADEDGRVELRRHPGHPAVIDLFPSTASARTHKMPVHSVPFGIEDDEKKVTWIEQEWASLRGTVRNAYSEELESPRIAVVNCQDLTLGQAAVDSTQGFFRLQELPPGKYQLIALCELGAQSLGEFDVDPGADLDLGVRELREPAFVEFYGDAPLVHESTAYRIVFEDAIQGQHKDWTIGDGVGFPEPRELLPGNYRIEFARPGGPPQRTTFSIGDESEVSVEISAL